MNFAEPFWFFLLVLLVPMWWRSRTTAGVVLPHASQFFGLQRQQDWLLAKIPLVLRTIILILLTAAMARPQASTRESRQRTVGIDIVLAIDTSGSMRAMDFQIDGEHVDRLAMSKHVIQEFIGGRPDDRIGMIVFGDHAFTQAPLTLDHDMILQLLDQLSIGVAGESTAIGEAIAMAVKRLKTRQSKSRIAILLTDGENSSGEVSPMEAAKAAATFGIKVYTIGIGSDGLVPFPVQTIMGVQYRNEKVPLDEKLLQEIAATTGANYYFAKDSAALKKIYEEIDRLERDDREIKEYRERPELFALFLWPGLCLLVLEQLFGLSRWRRLV